MNYVTLCYHYLKLNEGDTFRQNILGPTMQDCKELIDLIIHKNEVNSIWASDICDYKKDIPGVLFTFDDGLSEHYIIAQYLSTKNIQAIFFIPTCVIDEGVPANPTIIHCSVAFYGIKKFLKICNNILKRELFDTKCSNIKLATANVKQKLTYVMDPNETRQLLRVVFKDYVCKDISDAINKLCVSRQQVYDMLKMGHVIGIHSYSHPSLSICDKNLLSFEIISAKKILENNFRITTSLFSFPYGIAKSSNNYVDKMVYDNYSASFMCENSSSQKSMQKISRIPVHSRDVPEKIYKLLVGDQ